MKSTKTNFSFATILLLAFLPFFAIAGNDDPEKEFKLLKKKYPDYPIVSLLHKLEVTILPDKNGVPVMHIKEVSVEMIMSENGTDLSASKEYFNNQTIVKKLKAYSLVPVENKYKKIPVSDFKKSSEFDDYLFYDDTYCYSFNFPAVAKGVKRYTYCETEVTNPYYPLSYFFAGYMPCDRAELTIVAPESIQLNFKLFGLDTNTVEHWRSQKGKLITYEWTSSQPKVSDKDVLAPGFRYFRPHLIMHIASSVSATDTTHYMGSLEDLYHWLDEKSGHVNQTITPEIISLADSITQGISDTTEKVRAIYKWVQNNIKYIAIEDGEHGWVPREANLVLQRRYGDCKDKSSLLTTLLRAIGEKASLVHVGTRELPYKYSEFPSIACSNHMVTAWWKNGKPRILDGTSRNNKLEDVPATIQGKECILQNEKGEYQLYQIPIAPASANMQIDTIHLAIQNNLLTGEGKSSFKGEIKTIRINQLEGKTYEKQQQFWPNAMYSASDKLFVTKLNVSDLGELKTPLRTRFEFNLPDYLIRQGNKVYVNLNIERDLAQLKIDTDRVLPIEVGFQQEHKVVCKLKIPDNLAVSYLPDSISFNNPLFGFYQYYELKGRDVILTSHVYLKTLLIEGKDITDFRKMVELIKKAYRQTIVLSEETSSARID